MSLATTQTLWAPWAWLPEGWQADVLLTVDAQGRWAAVQAGQPCPPGAQRLAAPVLPGLVDAHSHAFQRAFAGLAEQRTRAEDDFWSWRDRMYRVAGRVGPAELRTIARQLYGELLRGGYTQVCEFHYLQHQPDGTPYDDPLTLSRALIDAAADTGIGLTLLPVIYERAGFSQPTLRPDQARFRLDADGAWALCQAVNAQGHARLNAGVAVHSLRAARPESLQRLATLAAGQAVPLHIHVAEQPAEVRDCLAATGQRPMQWLAAQGLLDARWQLVHATHSTPEEIAAVAAHGAGVVLCPGTEANLGDGLADLPGWLAAGVPLAIGSDSQVTRDWREELRWLEYGQRLQRLQRNVAADPAGGEPSGSTRLWRSALRGGQAAAGFTRWGLQAGARADLLVADPAAPECAGLPMDRWLDALVMTGPGTPWAAVMVAGHWAVQDGLLRQGHSAGAGDTASAYRQLMTTLWQ